VFDGGSVDEGRITRLRELLDRLGRAIHASVVDSDEVKLCLSELRGDGWDAVMLLEASLGCRHDENPDQPKGALRIHVGGTRGETEYRLGSDDARWLASIGVSPTRHRSSPRHPLPPLYQPYSRARDDG
jgi:hypothetical protein